MIDPEKAASILRLSQVEGWPVGTIARELGVHHDVVERVLRDAGVAKVSMTRPSRVDSYVPFICETWAKHPRLRASRLYHMCVDRGYVGGQSHFRAMVARLRPRAPAEAFLRLRTLPGEQAQVDWGHFGHMEIGRARRPLVAFVMVLSYSRAIYLRFMLSLRTEDFLVGHQGAFAHFQGCARVLLYDNLKSAVIERTGEAIPADLRLAEAAARSGEARALLAYTKAQDGGDLAVIRARDEELKAARAKVSEVVERIQRDAKKEAHLWYPVATPVEDLQGFLAPGEALVLYGLAEKDEIAHALVLTKDAARIVALGKSSGIVTACEALDPTDRDADPAAALATLRDLVVKPLGLAKETKRLLVSPDGPVSYVPFAALAPELVVAYESSGSTYGVLREEKDKHGEQVLALADADYTAKFDPISLDLYAPLAAARAGATRGGRLAALPGTREEAMAVADLKLFGKDASESGLRAALAKKKARWHSVHFACHGLVNPDRPTLSSLALTPEGENDGFLTALEVLKMEIPSDLVVLSACETGKGKIVGGEGIVGLTRAFMYAGSPRVVCSLWKVDDDATRALMTKLYELWNPKDGKPGIPTAEALKQAQEFIRSQEKWKHPYYWAAWVLWGLPQ